MSNAIPLIAYKGEARVDSRLIAEQLGNQHKASMSLVDRYAAKFRRFGVLPFQMEKPVAESNVGKSDITLVITRRGNSNLLGYVRQLQGLNLLGGRAA